jgi:RNA polymerase sigma-70 factor (ECF subfamily)
MEDIEQIIKGCVVMEKSAQHALYKYLAPKLMSICIRYTRSKYQADDYLQETFIKIFTNIKSYKGDGPIEAWARRIAVNTILKDMERKNPLKNCLELDSIASSAYSGQDINSDIRHKEMLNFINYLPSSKKTIFNLYVIEGYSHKEISELLSISEGTSKSQLSRAKEMLIEIHRKQNSSS